MPADPKIDSSAPSRSSTSPSGDSLERARSHALRLLKFRPRSEAELRRRLIQKGFSSSVAEALLAEMKRQGLLNDSKFARLFAAHAFSDTSAFGISPDHWHPWSRAMIPARVSRSQGWRALSVN